jgi:hypothetical protein
MKLIFFSSDPAEVERLGAVLTGVGIPCEIHKEILLEEAVLELAEAELWIQNDSDSHRAFMLCVAEEVGLAKKAARPPTFEEVVEARLVA